MSLRPGKTWLITGASSGLGLALAKCAAQGGDTVIGTVRTDAGAAALYDYASEVPGTIHSIPLDVKDRGDVLSAVAEVERRFGDLDIVVNNAGYGLIGPLEEASEAEARAQFDVNVFGAVWVIQAVLPAMRARRAGHIINITSVSGLAPWAGTAFYTASKYALEALGQTLHDEVAALGIHVTNVAPGGLRTEFGKGSMAMPAQHIADYDAGVGRMPQQVYKETAGQEPGDTDKAAQAIVNIAGADNPPLHLLLGKDALGYWRDKQASMTAEINALEDVSLSIAVSED
ncbi:MAG: oxidoreductase [Pseudomonadota bacterium]